MSLAGGATPSEDRISLRIAVQAYRAEYGAPANAYDWYRRSAQRYGSVSIGPGEVPAVKVGNVWFVSRADLSTAIDAHRQDQETLKNRTEDFFSNVLHGVDGDTIYTESGGYRRRGPFHFVWSTYEMKTMRSNGAWYCSSCFQPADVAHDKEECHRCADWGDCGRDCTASAVRCEHCEATIPL
jgi:hypothetical protein